MPNTIRSVYLSSDKNFYACNVLFEKKKRSRLLSTELAKIDLKTLQYSSNDSVSLLEFG